MSANTDGNRKNVGQLPSSMIIRLSSTDAETILSQIMKTGGRYEGLSERIKLNEDEVMSKVSAIISDLLVSDKGVPLLDSVVGYSNVEDSIRIKIEIMLDALRDISANMFMELEKELEDNISAIKERYENTMEIMKNIYEVIKNMEELDIAVVIAMNKLKEYIVRLHEINMPSAIRPSLLNTKLGYDIISNHQRKK